MSGPKAISVVIGARAFAHVILPAAGAGVSLCQHMEGRGTPALLMQP